MGMEVLCRLLMSSAGAEELRVLNPLLDAAEAAEVLSEATALLLRVSRDITEIYGRCRGDIWEISVSYTHLTLPTNREV